MNQPGLIGCWIPEKHGGRTLMDLSGKNNHGTLNGPTWISKNGVWVLSFDGIDDEIVVADDVTLDITQSFSIEIWFQAAELSRAQGLLSKGAYHLKIEPDNQINFGARISITGEVWTEVEDTTESRILAMAVFNGFLYAGTSSNGKIYRSSDGTTWAEVEDTTETDIRSMAVFNGFLYAGTSPNGKIYRSSDGTTWAEVEDTTASHILAMAVFNGFLYAGTYPNGKIYRMGGGFDLYSQETVQLNHYAHIVGTQNPAKANQNAIIYINGKVTNTLDSVIVTDTNNLNLLIGNSYGSTTGEEAFAGQIALLRIFNRDLGISEIRRNYDLTRHLFEA